MVIIMNILVKPYPSQQVELWVKELDSVSPRVMVYSNHHRLWQALQSPIEHFSRTIDPWSGSGTSKKSDELRQKKTWMSFDVFRHSHTTTTFGVGLKCLHQDQPPLKWWPPTKTTPEVPWSLNPMKNPLIWRVFDVLDWPLAMVKFSEPLEDLVDSS